MCGQPSPPRAAQRRSCAFFTPAYETRTPRSHEAAADRLGLWSPTKAVPVSASRAFITSMHFKRTSRRNFAGAQKVKGPPQAHQSRDGKSIASARTRVRPLAPPRFLFARARQSEIFLLRANASLCKMMSMRKKFRRCARKTKTFHFPETGFRVYLRDFARSITSFADPE